MIKAVVALGNSGGEYEKTYHNVGVLVAQKIAARAVQEHKRLLLYTPTTFMNVSGPAVASWMKMHNLAPSDIVVVHDEGDLPRGEYKLATGGGSAGHNGVASLIASLGTEAFTRLRIGIRDPQEQDRKKAIDFVLNAWSKADEEVFLGVVQKAWPALADSIESAP